MRRSLVQPRGHRGFTLLETVVVLAIGGIVLSLGVPSFLEYLERSKLQTGARQTAQAFQLARLEAIKRTQNVRVTQLQSPPRVAVWIDTDADGAFTPGTDLPLGAAQALPRGIDWWGPGDAANDHSNGSWGFLPEDPDGSGTAVYLPDGSASLAGAFRLADGDGRDFLEVRVENPRTGQVTIQKYFGNTAIETDQVSWFENGESGRVWTWN